jgi:hypothetical protein
VKSSFEIDGRNTNNVVENTESKLRGLYCEYDHGGSHRELVQLQLYSVS